MEYWTILLSIVTGLYVIHHLFRRFSYFKRNGIIHIPPIMVFGSMASVLLRQISLGNYIQNLYYYIPNAKYFGFYATSQPIILLRDPELIKEIFIKNFETFPNRRGFSELNENLFSNSLFSLRNQEWRDMRNLLSPAFTPSKIKTMYTMITEYAVNFTKTLSKISADESDMDMRDVCCKYANDVFVACTFGITIDSLNDPTNIFYLHCKEASRLFGNFSFKLFFFKAFPNLCKFLRLRFLSDDTVNFFTDIVKTIITTRHVANFTRPDIIQLMMDINGKCKNDRELSIDDMAAQAFIFFLATTESSSTAMSFIALEIAANPNVQAKLREEIDEALKNSNGEVSYEVINRLEYLNAVIWEVLRLHPPTMIIERICEKAYEFPPALPNEKSVILKKGQIIWVPIYAIHLDEKHYSEPKKFCPERFLGDNAYYNCPHYAPFGLGPRMCIANRFALLKMKIFVFHLLARCELKSCAKTTFPVKLSTKALRMIPEDGFWLTVQRRNDIQ